jgi:hypothetical protein
MWQAHLFSCTVRYCTRGRSVFSEGCSRHGPHPIRLAFRVSGCYAMKFLGRPSRSACARPAPVRSWALLVGLAVVTGYTCSPPTPDPGRLGGAPNLDLSVGVDPWICTQVIPCRCAVVLLCATPHAKKGGSGLGWVERAVGCACSACRCEANWQRHLDLQPCRPGAHPCIRQFLPSYVCVSTAEWLPRQSRPITQTPLCRAQTAPAAA